MAMAVLAPWLSAQVRAYADALLDILDPARELLSLRLYREHCCPIEASYTKDLSALDRKLQHLVLGPVGTYVPGAPYCTYGPASCVLYAPEAQGSLPPGRHVLGTATCWVRVRATGVPSVRTARGGTPVAHIGWLSPQVPTPTADLQQSLARVRLTECED